MLYTNEMTTEKLRVAKMWNQQRSWWTKVTNFK